MVCLFVLGKVRTIAGSASILLLLRVYERISIELMIWLRQSCSKELGLLAENADTIAEM